MRLHNLVMRRTVKGIIETLGIGCVALCGSCTISSISSLPIEDATPFIKGENVLSFDSMENELKIARFSNGYSNGGMFRSEWAFDRIRYDDGIGYLSVVDIGDKNYGAEIRTNQGYLYGYFGARIKPFKHSGTVQSLFTYNGGRYTWDEIDIEFLGKDTTHVQFNYYHDGVGGHELWYDLGFDASEDFHDYGFKWEENFITWYVDSKPVHRVEASLGQWGHFFANVWAVNDSMTGWAGNYEKTDAPLETAYDYMCYSPLEEAE